MARSGSRIFFTTHYYQCVKNSGMAQFIDPALIQHSYMCLSALALAANQRLIKPSLNTAR
jgi:hypothetical protein